MEETLVPPNSFIVEESYQCRELIEEAAKRIKTFSDSLKKSDMPANPDEDRGEEIANLMLAYRHLEDAKMRMGKVLQAHNGGVSNNPR